MGSGVIFVRSLAKITPDPKYSPVPGTLERFVISSPRSPARLVTVYVPEGSPRGAQVLVLHDGQNLFEPERAHVPGQHWRVAETADALIAAGRIPPVVIAGIDHLGEARGQEMTPTIGDRPGMGGGAVYGRFLMEDLLPYLARIYGVRTDAAGVGVGGSSLGGLITLAIACQYPGRLGRLLVMSPSVWWDDRVILRRLRRTGFGGRPRVWIDIGRREGARPSRTRARCAMRSSGRLLRFDTSRILKGTTPSQIGHAACQLHWNGYTNPRTCPWHDL
jgi:predicted alpha/beta superfamily hydrolase